MRRSPVSIKTAQSRLSALKKKKTERGVAVYINTFIHSLEMIRSGGESHRPLRDSIDLFLLLMVQFFKQTGATVSKADVRCEQQLEGRI